MSSLTEYLNITIDCDESLISAKNKKAGEICASRETRRTAQAFCLLIYGQNQGLLVVLYHNSTKHVKKILSLREKFIINLV